MTRRRQCDLTRNVTLATGRRRPARLVPTDEPYNVPIVGHVTGGKHREFAMASGGMTGFEAELHRRGVDSRVR